MKSILYTTTMFMACTLISTSILAGNGPAKKSSKMRDQMQLSVITAYDDCDLNSGIYQLMEDGESKVMELEPMAHGQAYDAFGTSKEKLEYFMESIGVDEYLVKSFEVKDIQRCGYRMDYTLIEK